MDKFTKSKRSEIMAKVRSRDSRIEVLFRKEIWKRGFRYSKNSGSRFGKPDLVLPKYKAVIFIDSCFWHGCPRHGTFPTTRPKFWAKKLKRNKLRDKEVNKHYRKKRWKIIRVWEHEINGNLDKVMKKVIPRILIIPE